MPAIRKAVTMSTSENLIRDKKKCSLMQAFYYLYNNRTSTRHGRAILCESEWRWNYKNLIEDPHGLCQLFNEGGKLFLDRGFRDAKDVLESKGFTELISALKGKWNQLTTKETNQYRFVTKIRWSVESIHGISKQKYRLLDHIIGNKLLPNVGLYFKIPAFMHN